MRKSMSEGYRPYVLLFLALFLTFLAGFLAGRMFSPKEEHAPTVIPLPDKAYYTAVKGLIERANRSVAVIMYVAKYDPQETNDPVNALLDALIKAKERGVSARVVLDDATYRSYKETLDYLMSRGVDFVLDEKAGVTTHVKMVIVDGEYLVVGSHNWTESALSHNHEYSILVRSREVAEKALSYFNQIWSKGRRIGA